MIKKKMVNRRTFIGALGTGVTALATRSAVSKISDVQYASSESKMSDILDPFKDIPVIDSHFHMHTSVTEEYLFKNLKNVMSACGTRMLNIVSTTGAGYLNENLVAALCKAHYPKQIFSFGGLHYHLPGVPSQNINLEKQARTLIEMGFDGFKMLEGKPSIRKELDHRLDDKRYDGYYSFLESEKLPLVLHVADPWETEQPSEIKSIYEELYGVLKKFPNLHIIFAHFLFYGSVLDRAEQLLDSFPNVSLDLTPGPDMYVQFSKYPDKAHNFFVKHQDRIVFGTDNHGEPRNFGRGAPLEYWPVYKIIAMRTFLETDQSFTGWHHPLHGIALDQGVLEKIYYQNFRRYAGIQPRPLQKNLIIDECDRLLALAEKFAIIHQILPEIKSFIRQLQRV